MGVRNIAEDVIISVRIKWFKTRIIVYANNAESCIVKNKYGYRIQKGSTILSMEGSISEKIHNVRATLVMNGTIKNNDSRKSLLTFQESWDIVSFQEAVELICGTIIPGCPDYDKLRDCLTWSNANVPNDKHIFYCSIVRVGTKIIVSVGTAKSTIVFNNNFYVIEKDSIISNSVEETELRRNIVEQGLLKISHRNKEVSLVQNKIRFESLADSLSFIFGKSYNSIYNCITDVPEEETKFTITVSSLNSCSKKLPQIATNEEYVESRKQKRLEKLEIIYRPHLKKSHSWHIDYQTAHTVVTIIRQTSRRKPIRELVFFQINEGSTILKNSTNLSSKLKEGRDKLLSQGILEKIPGHPTLLKFNKPVILPHFSQLMPFITGYDDVSPSDVNEIFNTEPVKATYILNNICSTETSPSPENSNNKEYFAFSIEKTSPTSFQIFCQNTKAEVHLSNNVYSIVKGSILLELGERGSSFALMVRRQGIESKQLIKEYNGKLRVCSKIRSDSIVSIIEIVTGKKHNVPFSSIDEMPDSFSIGE